MFQSQTECCHSKVLMGRQSFELYYLMLEMFHLKVVAYSIS